MHALTDFPKVTTILFTLKALIIKPRHFLVFVHLSGNAIVCIVTFAITTIKFTTTKKRVGLTAGTF